MNRRVIASIVFSCCILTIACDETDGGGIAVSDGGANVDSGPGTDMTLGDANAPDPGMTPDGGAPDSSAPDSSAPDSSATPDANIVDTDAGTAACSEASCVHGSCEQAVCVCDAGWTGPACLTLDEPAEDSVLLWFDADHDDSFELGFIGQIDSWTARAAVHGPLVTVPEVDDKRPRRLPNQFNGRSVVIFDGVDDTLSSVAGGFVFWDGLDDVNSYTLVAVFQASVEDQIAFSMVAMDRSLGVAVGAGARPGQVEALHGNATAPAETLPLKVVSQPDTITATDLCLVTLRVSPTQITLRVNAEEVENLALDTPIPLNIDDAIVNLGVDSIFYPSPRYLGGSLAEVILFGEPLASNATEAVEAYLQAKWGL